MRRMHRACTTDLTKGAVAGMVGGLVGTAAMATFEWLWTRLIVHMGGAGSDNGAEMRHRLRNAGEGAAHHAQSEPRSHHHRLSPSERLAAAMYRKFLHRPAPPRQRELV